MKSSKHKCRNQDILKWKLFANLRTKYIYSKPIVIKIITHLSHERFFVFVYFQDGVYLLLTS